jgi:hypothetical protein
MKKDLNELLTLKISKSIPQNIKPINYLMNTLDISKESVYRRLRGQIPFTVDEVSALSRELSFSIDEIVGANNKGDRIFFDMKTDASKDPEDNFLAMIKDYYDHMDTLTKSFNVDSLVAINRINLFFLVQYDALFKFFYYKTIHQTYNIPVCRSLSEITVPEEIDAIQKQLKVKVELINNTNFIVSRDMFLPIIREIQYYYSRKLLTAEEIDILQQELFDLLHLIETQIQKGINSLGRTVNFYVSLLDIETNASCTIYDDKIVSQFWLYSINSMIIKNQKICTMHRKWLESGKKYSVLITQSNEILQDEFIKRQYKYIHEIIDEVIFY